jgi:hypothetical protein
VYTIEDHKRSPLKYPVCNFGHVWKQRGNVTGHCSKCHNTFEGLTLFDAHQRILEDGSVMCLKPEFMTYKGQSLREVDGAWRGPGMDEEALARRTASEAN